MTLCALGSRCWVGFFFFFDEQCDTLCKLSKHFFFFFLVYESLFCKHVGINAPDYIHDIHLDIYIYIYIYMTIFWQHCIHIMFPFCICITFFPLYLVM